MFTDRECQEATVLDISASGMRVWTRRDPGVAPGGYIALALLSTAGHMNIMGRAVWCKKKAFRRYELGVTFGEPSPELRKLLGAVMQSSADNYVIYDGGSPRTPPSNSRPV